MWEAPPSEKVLFLLWVPYFFAVTVTLIPLDGLILRWRICLKPNHTVLVGLYNIHLVTHVDISSGLVPGHGWLHTQDDMKRDYEFQFVFSCQCEASVCRCMHRHANAAHDYTSDFISDLCQNIDGCKQQQRYKTSIWNCILLTGWWW